MSEAGNTNKRRKTKAPQTVALRSEGMDWLSANHEWLEREHAGEWVALKGSELLAVGQDSLQVYRMSRSKGVDTPFVTAVRRKEAQGVLFVRASRRAR